MNCRIGQTQGNYQNYPAQTDSANNAAATTAANTQSSTSTTTAGGADTQTPTTGVNAQNTHRHHHHRFHIQQAADNTSSSTGASSVTTASSTANNATDGSTATDKDLSDFGKQIAEKIKTFLADLFKDIRTKFPEVFNKSGTSTTSTPAPADSTANQDATTAQV